MAQQRLMSEPRTEPARRRHRRPVRMGRRLTIVSVIMVVAIAAGIALGRSAWVRVSDEGAPPAATASPTASRVKPLTATAGPAQIAPERGAGTFAYATTTGRLVGSAGPLKHFRVAVENGSNQSPGAFAAAIDSIIADPRGWAAGGQVRLQRVSGQAAAEFTVFLATPATSEAMCATAGLHTDQYTSCRFPGKIVINLARWLGSVPDYGAPLSTYQAYALNHELGHELGNGHEACPAAGRPAPVMQQQTLGLKGCVANAWPYLNGQRYSGPRVP
jgi:hypothetical protein